MLAMKMLGKTPINHLTKQKGEEMKRTIQTREYEYNECLKIGEYDRAIEIAEKNEAWFENEAQRWANLWGEAILMKQQKVVKQ